MAQRFESSIDAGAAALRYADTLSTRAAAITPHLTVDWASGFADVTGTYSQFTVGGWSTQGVLSGSRFFPTAAMSIFEIAGLAGGSTHSDGTRTGEALINGRFHFGRNSRELFLGAGAGRAWDGEAWRSVMLAEVGASLSAGPGVVLISVSPALVNDSLKYADTQASLSWKRDRLDIGAVVGFRVGDQVTTTSASAKSWASGTAAAWLTPHLALVAGGGTYPIDPTQGFPGGRFVSLALRIAARGASAPERSIPVDSEENAATRQLGGAITAFSVRTGSSNLVMLTVTAPGARSVEVTGDFTNWMPKQLTSDTGTAGLWSVMLPMNRGKYQMNIRIDDGPWLVPPGILTMLDEFGGTVGLLIVE
ncbi:MAG: glycogen-binding domain-containing protein [Gemmatimonadaceae bacterium]